MKLDSQKLHASKSRESHLFPEDFYRDPNVALLFHELQTNNSK